ncbi:BTB/POZ and MATH domain-containing protein 1-like [Aegilops tauschii subsp. strangulata]|uniref:TD and POZ domain-containing protein 4 n=1 Tax=Aegilops tauschii TaxID=37682 RepID=M8CZT5_AEGTA|nr:BTB/POZ and MATH domain-containing protein 1-like [Aegilops tauschii subsp. strangulata]
MVDESMRSDTFNFGGHDWRLLYYPNGCGKEYEGSHVSLFLEHDGRRSWDDEDATTKAQASILDQAGVPSYTRTMPDLGLRDLPRGWRDFISHEDLDKQKHLKDDCLTILYDLTVVTEECTEVATEPEPIVVQPPFDLHLHRPFVEAIWNKERPDVGILVSGEKLSTHRWLLEARSPVLMADLSRASAATTDEDTIQLRVDDIEADVFKALLQFIYTDSPPSRNLLETAMMAEKLLVAADRYELEKLKRACEEALCRHIDVGSVAATLALAEQHDCPVLREACMLFLSSPGNLEAVVATDGFELLKKCCQSDMLELVVKKMI